MVTLQVVGHDRYSPSRKLRIQDSVLDTFLYSSIRCIIVDDDANWAVVNKLIGFSRVDRARIAFDFKLIKNLYADA